jgi:nucleoside-diphosphate-sugar epimerase
VENLVDAFFLAGTKDEARGQTYHVMDDYDVTFRQYLSDIAEFVGKPVTRTTFVSIPFAVAWPSQVVAFVTYSPLVASDLFSLGFFAVTT